MPPVITNTEPIELRKFSKATNLPVEKLLEFFDQEFGGYINYVLDCYNDPDKVVGVMTKLGIDHQIS